METPTRHTDGGNGNRITRERIEEELERARERASEIGEAFVAFVRERPGTALAIALGAGYLIGRILRR